MPSIFVDSLRFGCLGLIYGGVLLLLTPTPDNAHGIGPFGQTLLVGLVVWPTVGLALALRHGIEGKVLFSATISTHYLISLAAVWVMPLDLSWAWHHVPVQTLSSILIY